MADSKKLVWDETGSRLYETGVSQCALYVQTTGGAYGEGVAWNGITGITESPSGAEASPQYADNIKYLNLISAEEFGATVEAFMYPDAFGECDGSATLVAGVSIGQQTRKQFGLAYKTLLGNDSEGESFGYKIHLIYGATAAPSEKAYATVNDSPEAMSLSWELSTTPVSVSGFKPTACVTIDSTASDPTKLAAFEEIIYGSTTAAARLPLPDEVKTLMTTIQ